ncbi:MAG: DNA polymerase III subunit delta [Alphaproteobacteria bacterium]
MQVTRQGIEAFLKAPPAEVEIVLLHGPDAGMVRERSKRLEAAVLGKSADPFRLVELSEAALKDDAGALYAEAAAISMLGGRKFLRVRTNAEAAGAALEAYAGARAAGSPRPDALAVIEAGDLKPTQRLRKLAESLNFCTGIGCYPDDAESLETLIDEAFKTAEAKISPEARALLAERLGADRALSRQEIEKLLLYAGAYKGAACEVGVADVAAVIGDASGSDLDDLIEMVLAGDVSGAAGLAERLRAQANPVRILRVLTMQLDRLAAARAAGGRSFGYRGRDTLGRHFPRWTPARVARAQELVLQAEIDCKTTGMPAEEIAERTLLMLARAARAAA